MRVMVIGSGGREHAIVKKLKESDKVSAIFALPGNGGIAKDAVCVDVAAKDLEGMTRFATANKIDYAVVAPDDPLAMGAVDALEDAGIACFGPRKNAAVIESSKAFAKQLMKKYGIPTAAYEAFEDEKSALAYIGGFSDTTKLVVKADGLALGKGVVIAENTAEAARAVKSMMTDRVFGDSGSRVIIEEFLTGPEVSVLTFTDGKTLVPMVSGMDHKRASDGDRGLNTGGMGAVAPNPYYTSEIARECMRSIFMPTIEAMRAEGRPFKGCLYFGLMLTDDGPKVIEYNCRFGDPETQAVLPLLKSDLLDIMLACTEGRLSETPVEFSADSACCVVLASSGYPGSYAAGFEISLPVDIKSSVFVAGARQVDGKLFTSGGRVLGVTAVAPRLEEAISAAYADIDLISFEGAFCRRDIGARALAAK